MKRPFDRADEARMVTLSFLILYLELALIRWVPGYIHNFGYFTNFVMLAAFLGVGVGCLLAGRRALVASVPVLLLVLGAIVRFGNLELDLSSTRGAAFWSEGQRNGHMLSTTGAVVGLFCLLTLLFVGPGQVLGRLFTVLPRLRAYGLNVAGGLAGILVFAVSSHFSHPPIVWFVLVAALTASLLVGTTPRWTWPVHALLLVGFLGVVQFRTQGETWGPYYRHTLERREDALWLYGNGVMGIAVADFAHLPSRKMYEVPYGKDLDALRRHPGAPVRRALIIGCGAGNEVAVALASGAQHVDAVDINPWVIDVGKRLHPLLPFASDKVTTYVADGREFLARGNDKYDLIVYGLPDSTFTNDRANLRVESFLYTTEAFHAVLGRLSEDGVFVLYNYYRVPWLVEKIHAMLRDASGQQPYTAILYRYLLGVAMAVGPGLALPPPAPDDSPPPATDDWPFLYLVGPSIPDAYRGPLAAILLLSLGLVLGALRLRPGRGEAPADEAKATAPLPDPSGPAGGRLALATMFLMGSAFVLLETRSVVTFGLFFGSTWWTNVVVFAAIHVSVLLAVLVNVRFPKTPAWAMAVALLGSLVLAWVLPPQDLLVGASSARAIVVSTVAFLPIFCANVLFARLFRGAAEGRVSYAFNLLGGILGGLLEYTSLLFGYQALVGLATLFYLFALLFAYRSAYRGSRAFDGSRLPAP
jgi:hypothetical protein